jgi:hypothetical protein
MTLLPNCCVIPLVVKALKSAMRQFSETALDTISVEVFQNFSVVECGLLPTKHVARIKRLANIAMIRTSQSTPELLRSYVTWEKAAVVNKFASKGVANGSSNCLPLRSTARITSTTISCT